MTKIADIKITNDWQALSDLVAEDLTNTCIELFNAGREGATDILWTEAATMPIAGAYVRLLKPQQSVCLTKGTQDLYFKTDLSLGKLIVSKVNGQTVNIGALL